jgi:hypothetical protein
VCAARASPHGLPSGQGRNATTSRDVAALCITAKFAVNVSRGSIAPITAPQIAVRFAPMSRYPPPMNRGSRLCRYCCKSPKLPGANFLAVKKSDRRPPIDVAPITLPRPPASLSSGNEVPHIFTRKSRVQPKEILITSAKRLLQQNLPQPDSCTATK